MKGFLYFTLGAAIGAGVSFIFTKRALIKKNDKELASMDAYYRRKYGKTKADILREQTEEPELADDLKPSEEVLKLEKEKSYSFDCIAPVNAPMTDYTKKYKSIERKESDEPFEVHDKPYEDGDVEDLMAGEVKGMAVISDSEWEEDDEYEKREVTYYWNDEIFVDEYGVPIEHLSPDDFGRPNLEHFGITGEEGVLYCRDSDNMVDYRINMEDAPYEESSD